ncbi:MAG TPA: NADH-quinone oxidoreductase subunit C [Anaerolineae bacterium]|nr:NADH-quinone oxidoreductase subunit C [Anaerolineae bacterium]
MNRLLRQLHLFEEIFSAFQAAFPDDPLTVQAMPIDETFVTLAPEHIHEACEILVERFDFYHLSTITGLDTGAAVELFYHFWNAYGITLRTALPYTALRIATLTDFIPGAAFYERELYTMLGVVFEGHVNLQPLLQPDDWDGSHPLRKT